jgi:hypothetical protein
MQAFGRPRAAVLPFTAVGVSAALFLLIAVSVAFQPPTLATGGGPDGALAWVRALLFVAAAFALVMCVAAFARPSDPSPVGAGAGEDDAPTPDRHSPPDDTETVMRFTLIALGADEEDARAIADFESARALLAALRAWHQQYPDEELRIFGPDGAHIASRWPGLRVAAGPVPAAASLRPQARVARLVAGGA